MFENYSDTRHKPTLHNNNTRHNSQVGYIHRVTYQCINELNAYIAIFSCNGGLRLPGQMNDPVLTITGGRNTQHICDSVGEGEVKCTTTAQHVLDFNRVGGVTNPTKIVIPLEIEDLLSRGSFVCT